MKLQRKMAVLVGNGAKGCKRVHLSSSCGPAAAVPLPVRMVPKGTSIETKTGYSVFKERVGPGENKVRPPLRGQVLRDLPAGDEY